MRWQGESTRKKTGGRLKLARGKRKHEIGREATKSHIGEIRRKKVRIRGGGSKMCVLRSDVANVTDPKTGETKVVKIETVEANPANQHYVRRNILTKSTIIRTELGKAKVTSRPGQDGMVNAILVE